MKEEKCVKLKFEVSGMTCAACSARVEKVTKAVAGVADAQVNLMGGTMVVEAETDVKVTRAESAATVTAAERQAVLERETTETEVARRQAERELIEAQTKAQAAKLAGFAEAEVMRAKGYTEKDVIQAQVQKAYAEGLGNMTINGNGGGVAGDMLGLGIGMAAAGAVSGQVGDMFKGFTIPQADASKPSAKIV